MSDNDVGARGRAMRRAGVTWREIAAALGMSVNRARKVSDPVYAEEMREYEKHRAQRRRDGKRTTARHQVRRPTVIESRMAVAALPVDTRGLTARLMGDPLPGRSAGERKGNVYAGAVVKPTFFGPSTDEHANVSGTAGLPASTPRPTVTDNINERRSAR